ncbi:MAG TPA: NBR1-Ig-like domain-containing protein [Opitutaceae bacterium]|jgi:uncharacterized protein (TIGR03437 family)|nr:NBR1-Ig-like domain-containing protein [Opitutaceae bacterium]
MKRFHRPLALLFVLAPAVFGQVSMLTQHGDNYRSGANLQETVLTPSNVNSRQFGLLFEIPVVGQVYAQPLYIPNLNGRNVLFVATMENNVYAFDADTGDALWTQNLGTPPSYLDTVKPNDSTFVASNPGPGQTLKSKFYTDINGDVGILSTPVINGTTLYCVAKVKEATTGQIYFTLNALDVTSGIVTKSIQIGYNRPNNQFYVCGTASSLPPDGVPFQPSPEAFTPATDPAAFLPTDSPICDTSIGKIVFDPQIQLNRPALLYLNNRIYVAFGGHGDYNYIPVPHTPVLNDPQKTSYYHGWVMSFDPGDLHLINIFNDTRDLTWGPVMNSDGTRVKDVNGNDTFQWRAGWGAGIWQAGQGLASDGTYIYLMTGNGSYHRTESNVSDTNDQGLAMTYLKLDGNLSVVDQFNPANGFFENQADKDIGSSGPLLIPSLQMLVGGGKSATLYSLSTASLAQPLSSVQVEPDDYLHHIHGSPVSWADPSGGMRVFLWPERSPLSAYHLDAGGNFTSLAVSTAVAPNGMPAATLALTANGNNPGTGIIWASLPYSMDASENTVSGIVRAYDATNVAGGQLTEIWNSASDDARSPCNFAKYCPMTVVNGKAYRATFSNKISIYGLKIAASAASYISPVAVESIATAFGSTLATATAQATTATLPTTLAGTTITILDSAGVQQLAPLYSVSPTQIIYEIPPGTALGRAKVTITNGNGVAATGVASIAAPAPGLFSADTSGGGLAVGEMFKTGAQSLELLTATGNYFDASTGGAYLILYGTGIRNQPSVTATIGGLSVPVVFAGPQGSYVGEDQVLLGPLPTSLKGTGWSNVVLSVNSAVANTVQVNFAGSPVANTNYTSLVAYNPASQSISSPVVGVIQASPNPMTVCDGSGLGTTTLTWISNGTSNVQVHAGSPNGPLIAQSTGITGTQALNHLVPNGTVFFLQNVSGGLPLTSANTLAVVTTYVTTNGCSGHTTNGATYVSQSVPTSMTAGHAYNVSVTLRNSGTTTWLNPTGTPSGTEYALLAANYPGSWNLSTVELPNSVASGTQVTLNFSVTAPTTSGNYVFQWRMAQMGVQWFGDTTPAVTVNVHP